MEIKPASRDIKGYLGIAARGVAMGCADVVPGVSGGTMAFILGIYEELVDSIRMLTMPNTLKHLFQFDLKWAWAELPWRFLLALGTGILVAIISMARVIEWALHNYEIYVWSFFFGLVVASIITVRTRVSQWHPITIAGLVIGTVIAFLVVSMVPVETPNTPWFLSLSGAIAICAMILPGISGSFLLLILGKYEFIISAVNDRDIVPLIWLGLGMGVGIVTFAQLVGWLFKHYRDITISVLIGFMVGSLWKIWPWKIPVETYTKPDGEVVTLVEQHILPVANGDLFIALIFMAIGFGLVFVLEQFAVNKSDAEVTA